MSVFRHMEDNNLTKLVIAPDNTGILSENAKKLAQRHEKIICFYDKKDGLKAIIAIHNTKKCPPLGGLRLMSYKTEEDAFLDALRLGRAMTYKANAANLSLGGGKAVIMYDKKLDKQRLIKRFSEFFSELEDEFIIAEDIGTNANDMQIIHDELKNKKTRASVVCCLNEPSPFTAHGVYLGIKYCLEKKKIPLNKARICIQGVGNVGSRLVELLAKDKCRIFAADIDENKVKEILRLANGITIAKPDEIYDISCDVFCPCALGGIINDDTINRLKCKIIAGCANNQLLDEQKHGKMLHEFGILYAPDFVINAGGLINCAFEYYSKKNNKEYSSTAVYNEIEGISLRLRKVFSLAEEKNIPEAEAAVLIAEKRL